MTATVVPKPKAILEIEAIRKWAEQPVRYTWRRWYQLLHVECGVPVVDLRTYKPSIDLVCDELMGRMVYIKGVPRNQLPSMKRRIEVFKEAIDIIASFKSYSDILRLAVCRRQVTNRGGLQEIDLKFFRLVVQASDALTPENIHQLADRMPDLSVMRAMLHEYADVRRAKAEMERIPVVEVPEFRAAAD